MANINVTYEQMESAAQRIKRESEDMRTKLNQLRSMVETLVQDGFVMDKSSPKFNESYGELDKGGNQVVDGLNGIGEYLKEAARVLGDADDQLANALNK